MSGRFQLMYITKQQGCNSAFGGQFETITYSQNCLIFHLSQDYLTEISIKARETTEITYKTYNNNTSSIELTTGI